MKITVLRNVLEANENKAKEVSALLTQKNISMFNLISAPGSGKTSVLEATLPHLQKDYKIGVIEGDIASARDADRLKKFNSPIVLINTDGACHLDSHSIEQALTHFDLDELDVIFIENVGNMVCPAEFDLGEDKKIAILSTPEGDDKPVKYPLLFREAELVLLNKIDLLPYVPFQKEEFYSHLKLLNGNLQVIEVSCMNDCINQEWLNWLIKNIELKRKERVNSTPSSDLTIEPKFC